MAKASDKSLAYALLAVWSLFVLFMSLVSPWVGDDLEYMNMSEMGSHDLSGPPIASMSDIAISQWNHYFSINGRSVAHTLVQLFCAILGQRIFAVVNALFWPLLVWLVARYSRVYVVDKASLPQTIMASLLLLSITFGIYWTPTCQIGYIWMYTVTIAFLLFYNNKPALTNYVLPLVFVLSLVVGWGHESLNIGICGALWLGALQNRFKLSPQQWVMLTGFTIGVMLICFSPAALSRLEGNEITLSGSIVNFVSRVKVFHLLMAYIVYAVLSGECLKAFKKIYSNSSLCINAIILLLAFNFYIGIEPTGRQLMGIELLSAIVLLKSYPLYPLRRKALIIVMCGLTVFSLFYNAKRARHALLTRISYNDTLLKCQKAKNGATVYHTFALGDTTWPGGPFLETMERYVKIKYGKEVNIVPLSEKDSLATQRAK